MELNEVLRHQGDVIERVRAIGVACKLHLLPARESGIDGLLELVHPHFDLDDFRRDVGIPGVPSHLLDLLFELDNGLLEIEYHLRHGEPSYRLFDDNIDFTRISISRSRDWFFA